MLKSVHDESTFLAVSSKIIQQCTISDVMVRKSVLALTDLHKRDINAMRVSYERTTRELRAALQRECAARQQLASTYQTKIDSIAAATRSQEQRMRLAREREMAELRTQYELVQSAQNYEQSIVAQLHHEHTQELQRVKEASIETLAIREKEIALLQCRVTEEMEAREEVRRVLSAQCVRLTEEAASLRLELQELRANSVGAQSSEREALMALVHTQTAVVHAHKSSLNTVNTQRADVEVHLSRLRSMLQQFVTPLAFNSQLAQSMDSSSGDGSNDNSDCHTNTVSSSSSSCSRAIVDSLCERERKGQEMLQLISELLNRITTQLETISKSYQSNYEMHVDGLNVLSELTKVSQETGVSAISVS